MQHYFLNEPLTIGQEIRLPKSISRHLSRVLRAKPGDRFQAVSSSQQVYLAQIKAVDDRQVTAVLQRPLDIDVELPVKVTIVSGLSKQNKPELIVQKATELGVDQVIFLPMARSIVKWDQKSVKKISRLNEVALSAAEQSHRNRVPNVQYMNRLSELTKQSFDVKLVAYEESAKEGEATELVKSLAKLTTGESIVAVFGPEGGISPEEIAMLTTQDYLPVGLGPRILRTETAPMYFLTAVSVMTELFKG